MLDIIAVMAIFLMGVIVLGLAIQELSYRRFNKRMDKARANRVIEVITDADYPPVWEEK